MLPHRLDELLSLPTHWSKQKRRVRKTQEPREWLPAHCMCVLLGGEVSAAGTSPLLPKCLSMANLIRACIYILYKDLAPTRSKAVITCRAALDQGDTGFL